MIFGSGVRKTEPKICARSFVKPLKRKELAGRNTEAVARIVLHNSCSLLLRITRASGTGNLLGKIIMTQSTRKQKVY